MVSAAHLPGVAVAWAARCAMPVAQGWPALCVALKALGMLSALGSLALDMWPVAGPLVAIYAVVSMASSMALYMSGRVVATSLSVVAPHMAVWPITVTSPASNVATSGPVVFNIVVEKWTLEDHIYIHIRDVLQKHHILWHHHHIINVASRCNECRTVEKNKYNTKTHNSFPPTLLYMQVKCQLYSSS